MTEFHCKRCGKCCGIMPFSKQEYKAIRSIAEKRHITFVKEGWGNRELDNELDNLHCPFLDYDVGGLASCSIYENRPEICRIFGHGGDRYLICPNNLFVGVGNE